MPRAKTPTTTPSKPRKTTKGTSPALNAATAPSVVETKPTNGGTIDVQAEIRRRAYELFLQRGGNGGGNPMQDWLDAEAEVMQRFGQRSA